MTQIYKCHRLFTVLFIFLHIAVGISGQIQHIAGMQESSIIISINPDADAPINTIADYVITGDMETVVPKLIKYYKKNSK